MKYNYFVKLFKFWIIRTTYDLLMFICGLFQCFQCHKYTIYFKLIILTLNYNDIYHTIVWFTVVEKYSQKLMCLIMTTCEWRKTKWCWCTGTTTERYQLMYRIHYSITTSNLKRKKLKVNSDTRIFHKNTINYLFYYKVAGQRDYIPCWIPSC